MKCSTKPFPQQQRGAITLTELLVVIRVTSLLFVTVLAGTSGDSAKRLACADNLRRLNAATQMWAGDNGGKFPSDGLDALNQISGSFRNTLINNFRLKREVFYCPANPDWNRDDYWFYSDGINSNNPAVVSYFYFTGCANFNDSTKVSSYYPNNGALNGGDNIRNHLPAFAMKDTDKPYWKAMWSDMNQRYLGSYLRSGSNIRSANHFGNKQPLGSNESYLDGHVEWVNFSKFSSAPKMSWSSTDYFFYGNPQ